MKTSSVVGTASVISESNMMLRFSTLTGDEKVAEVTSKTDIMLCKGSAVRLALSILKQAPPHMMLRFVPTLEKIIGKVNDATGTTD